jgi:hypothetical protein
MNYNGLDLEIMKVVQNGAINGSNTVANLKTMFGSSSIDNLISQGLLSITGNYVNITINGVIALTPVDLSETSSIKSDSSSSLLFS